MPSPAASTVSGQPSLLDSVLLAEWEDRAEQGLFRYDVTACPTKLVPGPYGFIAQCNEGRASKKRPTEFRVDQVSSRQCTHVTAGTPLTQSAAGHPCTSPQSPSSCGCFAQKEALLVRRHCPAPSLFCFASPGRKRIACTQQGDTAAPTPLQVCQPWDPKKFNFTKALQKEVLFQFEPKPGSLAPEYSPAAPTSTSPNLVFINVSPIEYGHVLLVPRVSAIFLGSWFAQADCALHLVMLGWQALLQPARYKSATGFLQCCAGMLHGDAVGRRYAARPMLKVCCREMHLGGNMHGTLHVESLSAVVLCQTAGSSA